MENAVLEGFEAVGKNPKLVLNYNQCIIMSLEQSSVGYMKVVILLGSSIMETDAARCQT